MAPSEKKRSRPIPSSSQRSKKRQRTEHATPATEKRPVKLDALPWNQVELPDMFEDAEGFFGLEEIDGVDIVREGDAVKFVRFIVVLSVLLKMLTPPGNCYSGGNPRRRI
jgi:ATP-dependent RNA helicase DDX24/MAK5